MRFETLSLAIICALASLALFIFSTKRMSTSLKTLGNTKFKKILKSLSKNNFIALIIGALITTLIQSSDGAVALIMGLLAAKFIGLRVAIAFLLGANIGTATTSLIVSFQSAFAFTDYFILFMVIGVFGWILVKKDNLVNAFLIILSIGMIFFSLKVLSSASKEIVKSDGFRDIISVVAKNPWLSFIFSFGLTGILQSSSATVTLYQIIYNESTSVLSLNSAIALVFGSNIGTTVTGLIVAFASGNANSKKIALVWGLTNLSISLLLLPFLYPFSYFADLIRLMIPDSQKALQLSISHLLFNILLVAIFFWLIKYLELLVNKIVKDKNAGDEFNIILPVELIKQNTFLALSSAKKALYTQALISKEGISLIEEYIETRSSKATKRYQYLEQVIENTRTSIYDYLIKISSTNLTKAEGKLHLSLILSARSVDKIMGLGQKIIEEFAKVENSKSENGFELEEEILTESKELLKIIKTLLSNAVDQLDEYTKEKGDFIDKLKNNLDALSLEFSKLNIERLKTEIGQKQLEKDFDYSRLLRTFERIAHHCQRINSYIKDTPIKIKKLSKKEEKSFIEEQNQ
ncbi:Na/Pi cotransporter family protein [Mycoplasma procyoni]|uniref:Na/Pi cotransporter family protein n=1 Tax=Mycoplasma procyoni TaxID=568784 RepID=UPI00197C3F73|nr:Na/Pi symporter [Mycoplasma procyoni]MBN3534364.1 Na/Pi cotransporter family protein [Mycoplasma procyoni]